MTPTFAIDGDVAPGLLARLRPFLATAAGRPVIIEVQSSGGSAFEGVAVYEALRAYRGTVTTRCVGLAASAAGVIFLAGQRREIAQNAFVMVHEASLAQSGGRADDLRRDAAAIDAINGAMARIVSGAMGTTPEAAAALLTAETWFGHDDALRLGIATHSTERPAIAARFDPSRFRNPPAALRGMNTETDMDSPFTEPTATAPEPVAADRPRLLTVPEIEASLPPRVLAKLGTGFLADLGRTATSPEQVRAAAMERMADPIADRPTPPSARIIRDERDTVNAGLVDYIAARLTRTEPKAEGEQFRGMRIGDVAAQWLRASGRARPRSATEAVRAALTTSDFPALLGQGGARMLAPLFQQFRSPLVRLCTEMELPDFRPMTIARMQAWRALDRVVEGGPVTNRPLDSAGETIRLATYSNKWDFTREAMVNDDLGAFEAFIRTNAAAAAETERGLLVGLLNEASQAGPVLSDGNRWFTAGRGNILTPSTLDVTGLNAAISTLRQQRDLSGTAYIPAQPGALVVGPALEATARQLAAGQITPVQYDTANPWAGVLEPIVEPALAATTRWWLAARPDTWRSLALATLEGQRLPLLEQFSESEVLGSCFRVTYDVATTVSDPVGWVRSA